LNFPQVGAQSPPDTAQDAAVDWRYFDRATELISKDEWRQIHLTYSLDYHVWSAMLDLCQKY